MESSPPLLPTPAETAGTAGLTSRASKRPKAVAMVLGAAGVALLLFLFAPERHAFYPRCMLNSLTGLQCPGCGGLRATHQLLHGNVQAALQLNPLIFLLLPLLGILYGGYVARVLTGRAWFNPFRYRIFVWLLVGLMVVFGVVRNLPSSMLPVFGSGRNALSKPSGRPAPLPFASSPVDIRASFPPRSTV